MHSVPHERLFIKLKAYGIVGNVFHWIRSFLSQRTQRVVVSGQFSESRPVLSGVPQGSVLGPLLFILFINDLPDHVKTNCKMFADDTKIYSSTDQITLLQDDIFSLFRWSHLWQLEFNISKCKVLHVGKNNQTFSYSLLF